MTEMECKQTFAAMSAEQLLPHLYKAEGALGVVWPIANRTINLENDRNNAVQTLSTKEYTNKIKTAVMIFFGLAAIVMCFLSMSKGFLAFIFKLLSIFSAICTVASLITLLPEWKSAKDLKTQIPQLEADLAKATAELEQAKEQHRDWLLIRSWICPEECYNPTHMRVFVKFFEDGRANSLKEARNLFDEYIHRQRMENAANAQVAVSRAAAIAASDAKIAAQFAASAAQQAKYSADRAAFDARNK